MNKSEFDKKLSELNKLFKKYRVSGEQKKWVEYLKWDLNSLSEKNLEFIDMLILGNKGKNINKLTSYDEESIKNFEKIHRKTTIVFDSDKIKRWFIYLECDLDNINKQQVKVIKKLVKKENLYPNKLDKQEIEDLDRLVIKYSLGDSDHSDCN